MSFMKFGIAAAALAWSGGSVLAADVVGTTWLRDDGSAKIRIEKCQDALCGSIVWLKPGLDTKAEVGQRVVYDMRPDGPDAWSGKATKPGEDKSYSGTMSVAGDTLTLSGCLVGNLMCKTVLWTRSR